MSIYIYTYVFIDYFLYVYAYTQYIYIYIHGSTYVCTCICIFVYTYMIYVYLRKYLYMFIRAILVDVMFLVGTVLSFRKPQRSAICHLESVHHPMASTSLRAVLQQQVLPVRAAGP